MYGRIAISDPEADLLAEYTKESKVHFEIGCLWGGTSIIAAMAGAERIYTIDFMQGGFWEHGDPGANGKLPSAAAILGNFAACAVAHKISVYRCPSHPWPIPAHIIPDSVFIDGGHSYEAVSRDWQSVKEITQEYVIFHDYNTRIDSHPGVVQLVNEIRNDPEMPWHIIDEVKSVVVFGRYTPIPLELTEKGKALCLELV